MWPQVRYQQNSPVWDEQLTIIQKDVDKAKLDKAQIQIKVVDVDDTFTDKVWGTAARDAPIPWDACSVRGAPLT